MELRLRFGFFRRPVLRILGVFSSFFILGVMVLRSGIWDGVGDVRIGLYFV